MNYAIFTADKITATGTADKLWPGVTMPSTGPRADWLAEQNAVEIRHDPPHDPATHYLRRCEPYLLDGEVFDREAVERPPAPEPLPEPHWVAFAGTAVTDAQVKAMLATVAQSEPGVFGMLIAGLGDAAKGDPKTFLGANGAPGAWQIAQSMGFITPDLAAHVAALATTYDLPAEFVAALNPGG